MTTLYADSSALVKLVIAEDESDALAAALTGAQVVASAVALTEVPRALRRRADETVWSGVWMSLLAHVRLLGVDRALLSRAARLQPPELRASDAVHLASALALGAALDALVAYDQRLLAAAAAAGLVTSSPGRGL